MRKQSLVNSFKTALIIAPLLASCGGAVQQGQAQIGPNGLILPDCQDGQLVGVDGTGAMNCVSALTGMLTPPACDSTKNEVLTSELNTTTMKNELKCVPVGSGVNDTTTTNRITKAQMDVMNLSTMVTTVTSGGGLRSRYVGLTTATTSGRVLNGATANGIHAANLACEAVYMTGAHQCTPFELYETVVTATAGMPLDGTADDGPGMVYMQGWNNPFNGIFNPVYPPTAGAPDDPFNGQNENCGANQYPTGDKKWDTTVFTFNAANNGSGVRVLKFNAHSGCAGNYKIACCK